VRPLGFAQRPRAGQEAGPLFVVALRTHHINQGILKHLAAGGMGLSGESCVPGRHLRQLDLLWLFIRTGAGMNAPRKLCCAVYTRKSTEEGLDQNFNSLHAQRDACDNYIASQKSEGWLMLGDRYDDGGFSGGNMDRPGLKRLLDDVRRGFVDTIVVPTLPNWLNCSISTK